jgi:hypothetical protein
MSDQIARICQAAADPAAWREIPSSPPPLKRSRRPATCIERHLKVLVLLAPRACRWDVLQLGERVAAGDGSSRAALLALLPESVHHEALQRIRALLFFSGARAIPRLERHQFQRLRRAG